MLGIITVALTNCRSPADVRLRCLRMAHKIVQQQEGQADAYKEMVQEYYLRCLESQGVADEPVKGAAS
jgi:hypothetical protein